MKLTRPVAGAAIAALLLAACGGGGDSADSTSTTAAETTTEATTTTTVAKTTTTTSSTSTTSTTTTVPEVLRMPLTGEPVESEDQIPDRPALAVKIDNAPGARRNHTGLAVADIVYEEIVEGTITRFAAVFQSQDADPVGPIRSGRTQDVNVLLPYNQPLFAWSGGNPGVTRIIANTPFLTDLNWQRHAGSYYRGPGSTPHNLYSSTETLWGLTPPEHPGAPPQQFKYLDEGEEFQGEPTLGAYVAMDSIDVEWHWNPDLGVFGRRMEGQDHVDKTYGPITAKNVVVMGVDYQPSAVDGRSPEAQTLGNGPVWIFSDGKVVEGRWQREEPIYPVEYFDLDGKPIELNPGNTWIELARALPSGDPANPNVAIEVWPAE